MGDALLKSAVIGKLHELIAREIAWQESLQLANGALPMYAPARPGEKQRVCPYFSSFSAMALLLGDGKCSAQARRYMDWHMAHLNDVKSDVNGLDGTIYDHLITPHAGGSFSEKVMTGPLGKKLCDSTDSYAALFLHVIYADHQKAQDNRYLIAHGGALVRIYHAMCATLDRGLSFAKPDWSMKYTMDNCEVFLGLMAAERLFRALHTLTGDTSYCHLANESIEHRQALLASFEKNLWDERAGCYHVGIDKKGRSIPAKIDWKRYYPDAMAQLFPIWTGLLPADSARARRLYETFNQHFSNEKCRWEKMQGNAGNNLGTGGIIARAAVAMGDASRVFQYMDAYTRSVLDTGHPGCLNADGAHAALAADALLRRMQG